MKQLIDFIQVVPDVLTHQECAQIVRILNKLNIWEPTRIDRGVINKKARNCDNVEISIIKNAHAQLEEIDAFLFRAAAKALQGYVEATNAHVPIQMDTGYAALRYKKGGFYTTHVDHFPGHHRTLSCSFALNDNYDGGEWGFFGDEVKIKAPVGSAVLFPSNFCFPHQILPVTKGTRYSIVTWFI